MIRVIFTAVLGTSICHALGAATTVPSGAGKYLDRATDEIAAIADPTARSIMQMEWLRARAVHDDPDDVGATIRSFNDALDERLRLATGSKQFHPAMVRALNWVWLGRAYWDVGNIAGAREALRRAEAELANIPAENKTNIAGAGQRIAEMQAFLGDDKAAMATLAKVPVPLWRAENMGYVARSLRRVGRVADAKKFADEGLKLVDGIVDPYWDRAKATARIELLQAAGDFGGARAAIDKLETPDDRLRRMGPLAATQLAAGDEAGCQKTVADCLATEGDQSLVATRLQEAAIGLAKAGDRVLYRACLARAAEVLARPPKTDDAKLIDSGKLYLECSKVEAFAAAGEIAFAKTTLSAIAALPYKAMEIKLVGKIASAQIKAGQWDEVKAVIPQLYDGLVRWYAARAARAGRVADLDTWLGQLKDPSDRANILLGIAMGLSKAPCEEPP